LQPVLSTGHVIKNNYALSTFLLPEEGGCWICSIFKSTTNAEHYILGDQCEGWHFLKSAGLSVIKEIMPPMTTDQLHYHEKTRQFFTILSGVATFGVKETECPVIQGKGVIIKPGIRHQITNNSHAALEFIVISELESHGDRINIE